jgi:putative ABC transport system permease protein
MLRNYLKTALRTLHRRTNYALINGVGFTLGLICCVLVLLFIRHELR